MKRAGRITIGIALDVLALAFMVSAAGAATIKGKVTDREGEPIQGIAVCAEAPFLVYVGDCAWSQSDGTYAIEGLLEAGYHVGFRVERSDQNYARQWYSGKAHREEGALVSATGGLIEGIDAAMQVGGQITGRVTDRSTGASIADVEVCATLVGLMTCALDSATERRVQCAPIEADGHYVLSGLPLGTYVVAFAVDYYFPEEAVGPADGFVRRYWHEVQNFSEATPVGSNTPTVVSGIDAALTRGDEIFPPHPPSVIQGTIHPAPPSPPGEFRVKPKPKRLHCKKGFRRVTKSRHQRCVKIHPKKARHHRGRRKASHR